MTELSPMDRLVAAHHEVTLELGGKCPALLHPSFSVGRYADTVLQGKCFGAGQRCIAPDYLLVPEVMVSSVVAALRELFVMRFSQLMNNPDYAAIASDAQYQRLQRVLDDAITRGAQAVVLNPAGEDLSGSRKFPLTLLLGVAEDAVVHREEIFGPLLPVIPYRDLDEATAYINARPRPIALYYFDEDPSRAEEVLIRTTSGGATVNDPLIHFVCDSLPRSAMGAYQGTAGLDLFSRRRSVLYQSALNGTGFFNAPYRQAKERIIRFLLRR